MTLGTLLLGRSSPPSAENKLLLYKSLITPMWIYGIEMWGCVSKSTTAIIQRCQSKILRPIVDAPWYVTNAMIHEDLGIPTVQEVIHAISSTVCSTPFHEITSYEDSNDSGHLTCNTAYEISSQEGTSSR